MAFGMTVWDASGVESHTISDRLTRVLGIVSTSTASGSVTDSRLTNGTPWFAIQAPTWEANGKVVSFSGDTMSWTSGNFSGNIVYGIY